MLLSCVTPYNMRDTNPTPDEVAATFTFVTSAKAFKKLKEEYRKVNAKCEKVQSAMLDEIDAIDSRNAAIGSAFAAVAAGFGAATAIYAAAAGDDTDPTAVAVLGLVGSGSTVPTFFFFGSDERREKVAGRDEAIVAAQSSVDRAWTDVKAKHLQYSDAQQASLDADEALKRFEASAGPCAGLNPRTGKERLKTCQGLVAAAETAKKRRDAARSAYFAAKDVLDDSIWLLARKCSRR